ncbi:MAG: LacI family DNA-binding transcriptional regulator, partial [Pseudomonadota bacterium]
MATVFDVAKLAGVSIKTVSRVVNDEPSVRPSTRDRVRQAIDKLEYRPHSGARLMRSSKSGIVGMISDAVSSVLEDPLNAGLSSIHIVRGVQEACREAGKILMIADQGPEEDDVDVATLLRTFESHRVEGVIYAAPYHRQIALPLPRGLPLVLVNCFDGLSTPSVLPDDAGGQQILVEHLLKAGHRRIAYVGLDENMVAGRLRGDAFRKACADAGLSGNATPTYVGIDATSEDSLNDLHDILQEICALSERPTAICFGNDLMAMRGMEMLEQMGLRIPEDISVAGYDNDENLVKYLKRPLTTVTL